MARVAYRSVLDIRETILLVLGVAEVAEVAEVAVVDAVVDAASDAAAGPASAMCWKSLSRTADSAVELLDVAAPEPPLPFVFVEKRAPERREARSNVRRRDIFSFFMTEEFF